ncbi:outer membrane beta-barrel protein [Pseudoduganella sp. R-34]|uniref:outer membrane beta-barrel protein n=1 Tax=Pseudoduganella sp. R-34 TaxID=3404062 RepID=UPI003CE81F22
MKKQVIAVMIGAVGTLASLAHAADTNDESGHAYIGGSIGNAHQQLSINSVKTVQKHRAFNLHGGYQLDQNWGVEAGVVSFGKAEFLKSNDGSLTMDNTAVYAAATARMPLSADFAVFAKGGASVTRHNTTVLGISEPVAEVAEGQPQPAKETSITKEKSTRLSPMVGVGASYNLTKNVALLAEYDYFGKASYKKHFGGKVRADMMSVGVRVSF